MSNTPEPTPLELRFAATVTAPTDEQLHAASKTRGAVIQLASHIEAFVPPGRHKSLALTALEDVLMRSYRGIYDPVVTARPTGGGMVGNVVVDLSPDANMPLIAELADRARQRRDRY